MSNLPKTADVVVIGGGIIGAAVAAFCAKCGASNVVLIERNALLGSESTAKNAGGVRAQFASESNIRFSLKSIEMLEQWETALEGHNPHYQQIGYLFCTSNAQQMEEFKTRVALQNKLGVSARLLTPNEIRTMLPYIYADDLVGGTFCQQDGIIETASLLAAYEKMIRHHGGQIFTETTVTGIETSNSRVRGVLTNRGRIATEKIVNAGGAWASKIGQMAEVSIPIFPWRRQVIVTQPLPLADPFPMLVDADTCIYMHKESGGILMGWADPNQPKGFLSGMDEDYNIAMIEKAIPRLPLLEKAQILTAWAGFYETTPDHHAILGETKTLQGFYIAAGFSGHGVMHSPATGQVMAEIIVNGLAETLDPTPLSLERFTEGKMLNESVVI
ncbi:MAG: FAD-binding oxidoreductase [Nitrospirota bacterium]